MREVEILKKKQLKCYLYTRVSTSMQVDGYSLDAQRDKLRKYAAYEDMIVAGEYSDEGFSGKNIQGRQEFQRMLNDIQDGKDDVSYVLVFKLSRFGRNAADVLNSLQLMQDFGVNLICVEDGIDSSKDAGKLMISVLSAVAEIERENIRTQTMAGREQKAREGKWNGGFAPYGYKLENGNLVIAEDEVEVIRVIYDRYIHTNEGVAGVAKYLNRNGYTKKLRQNNTIPGFSRDFVKNVLYNPVYMGKIAYGRRRTEKKQGTRNEMHVVEQSEFPVYEGQHEAIISEEDWYLAQEKRKINSFKREKVNNPDHAHILSGILKCPCCGKSMYGNIAKAHSKDKKTRYYYYCKNTVTPTGYDKVLKRGEKGGSYGNDFTGRGQRGRPPADPGQAPPSIYSGDGGERPGDSGYPEPAACGSDRGGCDDAGDGRLPAGADAAGGGQRDPRAVPHRSAIHGQQAGGLFFRH